jgi:hypothetical protein
LRHNYTHLALIFRLPLLIRAVCLTGLGLLGSIAFESCGTYQGSQGTGTDSTNVSTPAADETAEPLFDATYDESIRTVQFNKTGVPNTYPIMELNAGQQLTLQFDKMGVYNMPSYQFTVIHCDRDWKPSSILQSDYLDGLYNDYVNVSSFSTNTYVKFAHYVVNFPTQQMRPKISGNYILKLYENDPDKPVLTRRFYVYENTALVGADVHRATYPQYNQTHQEVDFTVNTTDLSIHDPFKDISVVVRQNWREDNEIRDLRPTYVNDKSLIYNYEEGNLFEAGNEYRAFDTRDFHYKGAGVRLFRLDSIYITTLLTDEDRSYNTYTAYPDLDGAYIITTKSGQDANRDADYTLVKFSLRPAYSEVQDVYIYGALSNWKLEPRFHMTYDEHQHLYTCETLLKQGYYDYQYAVVDKEGKINTSVFEGNHWETENSYSVFVYYRPQSGLGDRLVGYTKVNTTIK